MSRRIEWCLWIFGILGLAYCASVWSRAYYEQAKGDKELDHEIAVSSSLPHTSRSKARPTGATHHSTDLVGRIEISRLHLRSVIFEGTDNRVLARGVGHLENSALPGSNGNVVLAAHRDTFFRPLRGIEKGDLISLTTPLGVSKYVVRSVVVVSPDETRFLEATSNPTLTLITCYPFYYVGSAPKRFIVQAERISGPPSRLRHPSASD